MIFKIEIERFRGIKIGALADLAPLTVLVGPNGCGKSTVLGALLIGAGSDPRKGIVETVQHLRGVRVAAPWLLYRGGGEGDAVVKVFANRDSPRVVAIGILQDFTRVVAPVNLPKVTSALKCRYAVPGELNPAEGWMVFFEEGRGSWGPDLPPLNVLPEVRLVDPRESTRLTPLTRLWTDVAKAGRKQAVIEILRALIPRLDSPETLTEADEKPILHLVFDTHSVPVALAGDGIVALTRMVLELFTMPSGLALVEEPESHQHPGCMRQSARAIWAVVQKGTQVVLTTHSLEFIDLLLAEAPDNSLSKLAVFSLALQDGELIAHRYAGPEVSFCRTEVETDLR
ncbi:MAG: AAA family ATPase [Planctomycetes bacterium]|nr:AAA family ATPase [Planctomycetota bacterium]